MAEFSIHLKGMGHQGRRHLKAHCEAVIATLGKQLEALVDMDSTNVIRGQIKSYRNLITHCDEIEKGPI
jgi:hypothetical protein